MQTYKVLSVFNFLSLRICLMYSTVVDNDFKNVQNGEIPSHSCIQSEFLVVNSTLSPRLQCGLNCNTDPGCVGFDLIETQTRRCRLLFGFPALIPTHTKSDQSARYQKVDLCTDLQLIGFWIVLIVTYLLFQIILFSSCLVSWRHVW